MTDKSKNRERIQATVSLKTYETLGSLASAKAISRGKIIDLIVSQWLKGDPKADMTYEQLQLELIAIKYAIESLDRRLSRIESNMVHSGTVAK